MKNASEVARKSRNWGRYLTCPVERSDELSARATPTVASISDHETAVTATYAGRLLFRLGATAHSA